MTPGVVMNSARQIRVAFVLFAVGDSNHYQEWAFDELEKLNLPTKVIVSTCHTKVEHRCNTTRKFEKFFVYSALPISVIAFEVFAFC